MKLHFAPITLLWLLCGPALAQTTWYVDDDNCPGPGSGTFGDPYCSIQDAIDDIGTFDGHTIVVNPGTYLENINFNGKAITIRSTDPNDPAVVLSTIIDGGGAGSVVTCDSGEGAGSVLSGFVITGGSGTIDGDNTYGGGMYNLNSSPTVTYCSFSLNSVSAITAAKGGGMYNNNSSPVVSNCTFAGNTTSVISAGVAQSAGGGMYSTNGGSRALSHCSFIGNSAHASSTAAVAISSGGGMYNGAGSTTVTDCSFSGNSLVAHGAPSTTEGGGLTNFGGLTITDSEFCANVPENVYGSINDGGGNEFTVGCPPPNPWSPDCPADFTGVSGEPDGNVDVLDLIDMLAAWGSCL